MDPPSDRAEDGRVPKRSRLSQDAIQSEDNIENAHGSFTSSSRLLPTGRPSRHDRVPQVRAARGASPARVNKNTNFSHATLPTFENFECQPTHFDSQSHHRSIITPQDARSGVKLQRPEGNAMHTQQNDRGTDDARALSKVHVAELSSKEAYPYSSAFDTDEYFWDEENFIPSDDNVCEASECTAKTCLTCESCEQSCYLPCDNVDECSSETCLNQSCFGSSQPTYTSHQTPSFDQCEWVRNGEYCTATVHSPGQTVQHVTENHIKPQSQITCEWDSCGIPTDVHQLPNHLWFDHEPASYVCLWSGCELKFSTHEELDAHLKTAHFNMGCHWAGCEMTTTDQKELQNHFSQNHLHLDDDKHHESFVDQDMIKSPSKECSSGHLDSLPSLHASNREPVSPIESPQTPENNSNRSEMAGTKTCKWTVDESDKIQCGLVFENGNKLQDHIRSSHIRPLKSTELKCKWTGCTYSHSSTKDKSKLVRHIYTHSKYCYGSCRVCHQEFSEKSKLHQHEATHLDVKPYPCPQCYRRFSTQNALTNHKRTHRGDKPLECGMVVNGVKCTYRCGDPSNMCTHKKTHLPPEFRCPICGKEFVRNDTMKRHTLTHDPKWIARKQRGSCQSSFVVR